MRERVTADRMVERIAAHFEDLAQEMPEFLDLQGFAEDLASVYEQPFDTLPDFLLLPYNEDALEEMMHSATDGELDIFIDKVLA
jgi:hypothetical protein